MSEWFYALWPAGADRWSIEIYASSEDELMFRIDAWNKARPPGATGSFFFGSFDCSRQKLLKELRRVPHNRDPDFPRLLEAFGRRTERHSSLPAFHSGNGPGFEPDIFVTLPLLR